MSDEAEDSAYTASSSDRDNTPSKSFPDPGGVAGSR